MNLEKFRDLTSTTDYTSTYNSLRGIVIQTATLHAVIAEVEKLQNQTAMTKSSDGIWNGADRPRIEGFLGIGRDGCGKTFAVETALKMLGPVVVNGLSQTTLEPNVLAVAAPSHGTATALAREIIAGAGASMAREPRADDAVRKMLAALARRKFTVGYIDQLHWCLDRNRHSSKNLVREAGLIWTMIISALDLPEWPTPIAITGSQIILDSFDIPNPDPEQRAIRGEAKRRLNVFRFPDLSIASDATFLESIIDGYCKSCGVENITKSSDEIGARLIHASDRAFGTALTLAQKAVALAYTRPRGKLNRDDFVATYHFTQGGAAAANVFAAPDWPQIDTTVIAPLTARAARINRFNGYEGSHS